MCALSSPAVVVAPIPRFHITDDLWKHQSLYGRLAQARRDAGFPRPIKPAGSRGDRFWSVAEIEAWQRAKAKQARAGKPKQAS